VNLTIYGHEENYTGAPCGAEILIQWTNQVKATKILKEKNKIFERTFLGYFRKITIQKVRLENERTPYWVDNFDGRINTRSTHRAPRMAHGGDQIFSTPEIIQKQLKESEVGIYKIEKLNQTFFSTKWVTICLDQSCGNKLELTEIFPGRGPGGRSLSLKGIIFEESRSGQALWKVVKLIESETGLKVSVYNTSEE
jgi:hypothetical protein